MNQPAESPTPDEKAKRGRRFALLVMLICAAPLVASYSLYYLWKPEGGATNYGTLLKVMPLYENASGAAPIKRLDGDVTKLAELKGKWIMLTVDEAACTEKCAEKLFKMRQVREIMNKDKGRIATVFLVSDDAPVETMLIRAYEETLMLRARGHALLAVLPVDAGGKLTDHIYVIDHYGNLMMRYPKDADPSRMKKDWSKLMAASKTRQ